MLRTKSEDRRKKLSEEISAQERAKNQVETQIKGLLERMIAEHGRLPIQDMVNIENATSNLASQEIIDDQVRGHI